MGDLALRDECDPHRHRRHPRDPDRHPALPLFDLRMGWALIAFVVALMGMGWAMGLAVCGLILRHGMGAESLAWTVFFALSPISCVYYPITILPQWIRPIAWSLPQTYVFEGMRAVLFDQVFRFAYGLAAMERNVPYPAGGSAILCLALRKARQLGGLMQRG